MSESDKKGGLLDAGAAGLPGRFPAPSLAEWQAEVVRLLKGAPFEKRMKTVTYEGITLNPIYTAADTADLGYLDARPGEAPFHRGCDPLGYRGQAWEVAQELPYARAARFNQTLRRSLDRGQTVVNLVFDRAGQAGFDPDDAPAALVGLLGTSISSLGDFETALEGVDLAKRPIYLQPGAAILPAMALLKATAKSQGAGSGSLRGAVLSDPLAILAGRGELSGGLTRSFDQVAALTNWSLKEAPHLGTVFASGYPYHEGGGDAASELGFTLAGAVTTLREMEKRGIDVATTASKMIFGFSVGTNFFVEIAKLRAARMLWAKVIESCDSGQQEGKMTIYARGSSFTKTAFDPYVNILRSTTEALAAVLGGCDLLHINPFDEPLGEPSDLARRLARNTQLILSEECHLDYLLDPGGGSWFVENLTAELMRKAWAQFQWIEAAGGLATALSEGIVQSRIAATADARMENIATRRDIVVGTNKYPNAEELDIKMNPREDDALPGLLAEKARQNRDGAENRGQSLANLAELDLTGGGDAADQGGGIANKSGERQITSSTDATAWLTAAEEAVREGATIGDLMKVINRERPSSEVEAIGSRRGAELFEELRLRVLLWRRYAGEAPQVFMANMGLVGSYMPRLDFARSFYQLAGLDVQSDSSFETPQTAAAAAEASGAAVVVIVGTDHTYTEVVASLAQLLTKETAKPWVVLAGYPKDQIEAYRAAGVDEFIHLRSDAYKSLAELIERLGVKS